MQGPGAEAAMQMLCTNNVAVPPGRIVYTGMLNGHGGYQTDCTVTRLAQNKCVMLSPALSAGSQHSSFLHQIPYSESHSPCHS